MGITHRIVRPQEEEGGRGHRKAQHPADLRIEAWGPTWEDCIAEAVRGLVDSFAVVAGRPPHARAERHMTAGCDEDPLASVIDEVIHWLEADGEIASRSRCGRRRMAGRGRRSTYPRASGRTAVPAGSLSYG
jgi:SHS2 domain-containing protein